MAFSYSTPLGGVSSGSTNTGSRQIFKWSNGTYNAYPEPARSGSSSGGGTTSLSGLVPVTPLTSQAGPMTAQNLPDWAATAGSRAASLADPFAEQRPQYQQQLAKLMSDPGSLATSPLYKFAQEQGLEAVNRTAGAKGLLGSGNRLADLTRFGTGLAGENFFKMAPILGRFAGADTSSPAAAGSAYAYGTGKAMEAFSNQEMERAFRDAMANQQSGQPSGTQAPLQAPLSTDPYREAYYGGQMAPQGAPGAPQGAPATYGGGSPLPMEPFQGSPLNADYSLDSGYGYTSPGAESLGGPETGSFYDQYGQNQFGGGQPLDYNPDIGAGGATDMGAGFGYDPWNPFPSTLSPIQGQLPTGYQQPTNTYGDWAFMGVRG